MTDVASSASTANRSTGIWVAAASVVLGTLLGGNDALPWEIARSLVLFLTVFISLLFFIGFLMAAACLAWKRKWIASVLALSFPIVLLAVTVGIASARPYVQCAVMWPFFEADVKAQVHAQGAIKVYSRDTSDHTAEEIWFSPDDRFSERDFSEYVGSQYSVRHLMGHYYFLEYSY